MKRNYFHLFQLRFSERNQEGFPPDPNFIIVRDGNRGRNFIVLPADISLVSSQLEPLKNSSDKRKMELSYSNSPVLLMSYNDFRTLKLLDSYPDTDFWLKEIENILQGQNC